MHELPFPTSLSGGEPLKKVQLKSQGNGPTVVVELPADYQQIAPMPVPAGVLFQPWASFTADGGKLSVVLSLAKFERDFGPGDAIQMDIEKQGRRVLQRRDQLLVSGLDSDILTAIQDANGGRKVARTAAFKHGQYHVQIEATTQAENYPAQATRMLHILSKTHLAHPPEGTSEPMARFEQAAPCKIAFMYPASWQLYKSETGDTLTQISLDNVVDSQIFGRVSILRSLIDTPADCLQRLRNQLERQQLKLGELAFLNCVNMAGQNRTMGQGVAWDSQGQQISVSVGYYWVHDSILWLENVSITRTVSPFWWAVNKRCFEIIADSLRLD